MELVFSHKSTYSLILSKNFSHNNLFRTNVKICRLFYASMLQFYKYYLFLLVQRQDSESKTFRKPGSNKQRKLILNHTFWNSISETIKLYPHYIALSFSHKHCPLTCPRDCGLVLSIGFSIQFNEAQAGQMCKCSWKARGAHMCVRPTVHTLRSNKSAWPHALCVLWYMGYRGRDSLSLSLSPPFPSLLEGERAKLWGTSIYGAVTITSPPPPTGLHKLSLAGICWNVAGYLSETQQGRDIEFFFPSIDQANIIGVSSTCSVWWWQ